MKKLVRTFAVGLVVFALGVAGTSAANASTPAVGTPTDNATVGIPVSIITAQGYTLAEVRAAVAANPTRLSLVQAPSAHGPSIPGLITPMTSITFGWYIYVHHISGQQLRALNTADGVLAAGILGLVFTPVVGLVAGAIYAYVVSIGNEATYKCAYWEMKVTYPAPTSRTVGASCS